MADGVATDTRVQPIANRVVMELNEIGEQCAERTHGDTSNEMSQALNARRDRARSCDRSRRYVGIDRAMRGCTRTAKTAVSDLRATTFACARTRRRRPACDELQTHVQAYSNIGPRFGVTSAPMASGQTTLRGSAGIFYDWLATSTYDQVVRVDGFHQREIYAIDPPYPALVRAYLFSGSY